MGGDEAGEGSGGWVTGGLCCHAGNYGLTIQRRGFPVVFHGDPWFCGCSELLPGLAGEVQKGRAHARRSAPPLPINPFHESPSAEWLLFLSVSYMRVFRQYCRETVRKGWWVCVSNRSLWLEVGFQL